MAFVVLNPTSGPAPKNNVIASRETSLTNSVIGLIDNDKRNSNTVLHAVAERLKQKYNVKQIIPFTKHSFSHPIKNTEAEKLAHRCDFVLAGVGD